MRFLLQGEEEADLELMDLIQKGEVAWLNASDAPKDKDISSARRGGRPPAAWRNDEYDDEPSTSKGQGLHSSHDTLLCLDMPKGLPPAQKGLIYIAWYLRCRLFIGKKGYVN